jgi:hypothetical protein
MSDLDAAWSAVRHGLAVARRVNRPEWHIEVDRWHVLAADPRPGRKRPDYVESVAWTSRTASAGSRSSCAHGVGPVTRRVLKNSANEKEGFATNARQGSQLGQSRRVRCRRGV